MKVLFLDIDGVCNSLAFAMRNNLNLWNKVDPALCAMVRDIIEATGCEVVLSSTWRMYPDSIEVVRKEVCELLDFTPDLQRGAKRSVVPRGEEVKAWLDQHPEVERYAILDDDSDFLEGQPLFKTEFKTGLTKDIANAVVKYLNRDM